MRITKNTLEQTGAALPCLHCENEFYQIRIYKEGDAIVMVCKPRKADCYPLAYYDARKCIALCIEGDELLTDQDIRRHLKRVDNSLASKNKLANIFAAYLDIRIHD